MLSRTIFPGRYVQGEGALDVLADEASRLGGKALAICDPFVMDNMQEQVRESIGGKVAFEITRFGGESSSEEIQRLCDESRGAECDCVIGMGGGKTLDTAKAVADEVGAPVVVVPTLASTDAPCSALSIIYTPSGEFERMVVLRRNPDVVLVDTGIIARAPVRLLVAGMGDALATWFEAESCRLAFSPNLTGSLGSTTAYNLAELCFEMLLEDGVSAKRACEAGVVTPSLDRIVEANTLLSGLGFESGGLATAHAVHNGLTVLQASHAAYHGEKAAVGTLASLFLTDKPRSLIEEVFGFCSAVGLPTTLSDVGLDDVSDEDLMRVATASCAEGETIHNEPFPVTPERVFSALKAMDQEGRARR